MTIELSKNVIDAIANAVVKKEVEEMAKFPVYEEFIKKVAEKALDEFLYNDKSIREWMQIIASEDAISRKAVLEKVINVPIAKVVTEDEVICRKVVFVDDIEKLPPVTSQLEEKTGYWITEIKSDLSGDMWPTNPKCSECGGEPYYSNTIYDYKFCPYCGIKMVELQSEGGKNE